MTYKGTVSISKNDVLWSYTAQFLSIASGIIILPIILNKLSASELGIYYILITITSLITLFDTGISPQIARNITYAFNGANSIKKEGFDQQTTQTKGTNYELLSVLIKTARYIYKRFAIIAIVFLLSGGTLYIYYVTNKFTSTTHILWIWIIYCISIYFNIFLLYYNSLLIGRGYIKESQKSLVFSKISNMAIAVVLVYFHCGLFSIVFANLLSPLIGRNLSRYYFYRDGLNKKLQHNTSDDEIKNALSILWPNIKKMSLISIAGYIVSQLGLFLSGIYLSLKDVASYGLMIQLVNVIVIVSSTLITIQSPFFASCRVSNNTKLLLKRFAFSMAIFYPLFILCSLFLIFVAPSALSFIHANATLPISSILITYCFIRLLETNHSCFANIIMSANDVPFLNAALISGLCTLIGYGLLIFSGRASLIGFVLVPGIVQLAYQNWRWPQIVLKEFKINFLQFIWIGIKNGYKSLVYG